MSIVPSVVVEVRRGALLVVPVIPHRTLNPFRHVSISAQCKSRKDGVHNADGLHGCLPSEPTGLVGHPQDSVHTRTFSIRACVPSTYLGETLDMPTDMFCGCQEHM